VKCNQVKGYALDSYNDCNEICGDGILIYYQCDDGNNLNGDGCSANCIIEDGWNCSVISHKSKCKLKGSISLYLHKVVKIPRENTIRITLKISLPLRLNNKNFQVIFTSLSSEYYAFDILAQD
jgi:cysteine-rich repeat protein